MNPEEKGKKSFRYWKNQSIIQNAKSNALVDCKDEYKSDIDKKLECESAVTEEVEKEKRK